MMKDYAMHEAVGTFDDHDRMEEAVDALQSEGFGRREISVLGSESAVEEKFGERHVKTGLLEDSPDTPRSHDITKEEVGIAQGVLVGGGMLAGVAVAVVALGGITLSGVIPAVVIGVIGGGAVGAVSARLMEKKYSEFFQNQIEAGGLLLWVNTPDSAKEARAQAILKEHGARNVHIHEFPVHKTHG